MISSLVGVGGGSMTVPYLMWYGTHIRNAVATSAANGLPIAIAGAAGYVLAGMRSHTGDEWQLGYIHLGALAVLVSGLVLFAPLGARAAHWVEPGILKKGFALLMGIIVIRMLFLN